MEQKSFAWIINYLISGSTFFLQDSQKPIHHLISYNVRIHHEYLSQSWSLVKVDSVGQYPLYSSVFRWKCHLIRGFHSMKLKCLQLLLNNYSINYIRISRYQLINQIPWNISTWYKPMTCEILLRIKGECIWASRRLHTMNLLNSGLLCDSCCFQYRCWRKASLVWTFIVMVNATDSSDGKQAITENDSS